jgi:hypothetical protein
VGLVSSREIGGWVERVAAERLAARRRLLDDIEATTLCGPIEPTRPSVAPPRATASIDMVATPVPATPTLPPPPLPRPLVRRAFPILAVVALGAAALAVLGALGSRPPARAPLPEALAAAPSAAPIPLPDPPITAAPEPPPAPPPTATAKATAAPVPRPRPSSAAPPQRDFKLPLYGRD